MKYRCRADPPGKFRKVSHPVSEAGINELGAEVGLKACPPTITAALTRGGDLVEREILAKKGLFVFQVIDR